MNKSIVFATEVFCAENSAHKYSRLMAAERRSL